MKKKLVAMMLSTAMVFSLAACGSSQAPAQTEEKTEASAETTTTEAAQTEEKTEEAAVKTIEPCTVTFWHAMSNKQEEALIALTDKFNSTNEYGITVELVNQGKYSDLSSKIDASVLSNELPDMSQVYNNWVSDYVDKLVTLDSFIESDFDNWDDIVPAFAQEAKSFGEYKVIPFNKSTYVYFYNKTIFDELNLTAPTTWDELLEVAEVIKAEKGLATIGYDDLTGAVDTTVLQNGGHYAEAGNLVYDDAEATEAINWFLDLYRNGYAALVGDDQYFSNKLSAGNIVGYIGSSTGASYITGYNGYTDKEGNVTEGAWDLGVAPIYSGKGSYAYQAGTNLAMFSTDANKQLACWEYFKFLTTVDSTVEWAMATGYLPVRLSAYETPVYSEFLNSDITAGPAYTQAKGFNGVYGGCYKGANDIRNTVSSKFTVFIQEGYTTEDAIKELVDEVSYILEY